MYLKSSLHIHTSDDRFDHISYSSKDLINQAAALKFDCLAITCHDDFFHTTELEKYAAAKNILLIPGIEKTIANKHVLILNADQEATKIKTLEDLRQAKKQKPYFIIAPHPYLYFVHNLGRQLAKNIDLFDAIEYTFFYTKYINFNRKALTIAKKYNLPLVGTGDVHMLKQLEYTYSIIETKAKTKEAVFEAIRQHKIEIKTTPLKSLLKTWLDMELSQTETLLKRKWQNFKSKQKSAKFTHANQLKL